MQRILLLDNYDSFTFNLSHYLTNLGARVDVVRNDAFSGDVDAYDKIVLSPGPGLPNEAGILMKLIADVDGKIPVLGVCLGMQAIAIHLGAALYNLEYVKHGVQENVQLLPSKLFSGLPSSIEVGLYHSWAVDASRGDFKAIAISADAILMGLENVERKLFAVQFHPESIMTPFGERILENFMSLD